MRRIVVALFLCGCGAAAKQTSPGHSSSSQVFHLEPNDDVGDAVTGSPSAPQSPGLNGPSTPGGPGGGGGTLRPKASPQ